MMLRSETQALKSIYYSMRKCRAEEPFMVYQLTPRSLGLHVDEGSVWPRGKDRFCCVELKSYALHMRLAANLRRNNRPTSMAPLSGNSHPKMSQMWKIKPNE